MLSNTRPADRRSRVAVIRAAVVGATIPGRTATKNRSRSVSGASAAATIQASSHERPVGKRTPAKPRESAARAIWCR
jgi:hypothetical protein